MSIAIMCSITVVFVFDWLIYWLVQWLTRFVNRQHPAATAGHAGQCGRAAVDDRAGRASGRREHEGRLVRAGSEGAVRPPGHRGNSLLGLLGWYPVCRPGWGPGHRPWLVCESCVCLIRDLACLWVLCLTGALTCLWVLCVSLWSLDLSVCVSLEPWLVCEFCVCLTGALACLCVSLKPWLICVSHWSPGLSVCLTEALACLCVSLEPWLVCVSHWSPGLSVCLTGALACLWLLCVSLEPWLVCVSHWSPGLSVCVSLEPWLVCEFCVCLDLLDFSLWACRQICRVTATSLQRVRFV